MSNGKNSTVKGDYKSIRQEGISTEKKGKYTKKLYKFYWDCGRCGSIEGLFVSEESRVKKVFGIFVYFGEILGRHSEIGGILKKSDIKVINEDINFINKLVEVIGSETISGYNPIDRYEEYQDEYQDEDE